MLLVTPPRYRELENFELESYAAIHIFGQPVR
jgi:hypothetical protein